MSKCKRCGGSGTALDVRMIFEKGRGDNFFKECPECLGNGVKKRKKIKKLREIIVKVGE